MPKGGEDVGLATLHVEQIRIRGNASVQYGPGVRAIVGYLSKYQLIPSERLEEMMSDIFNTTLSEGTIDNISNYAEDGLKEFKDKFEAHVPEMKVGNADETTTKVDGKLGHMHVLSNEAFTFLCYDVKRGMAAVSRLGFLEKFKELWSMTVFQCILIMVASTLFAMRTWYEN